MPKRTHSTGCDPELKQKALTRLKRIEGQVRGVAKMIDEERYCPDVMMQLSAIHESLRAVGQLMLRNHLEHCATDALRSRDKDRAAQTYDELTKLFYQHAR
ncbi:MAG TPA: metal-sensitive transcriptional regulator [Terriglobales bacterium]